MHIFKRVEDQISQRVKHEIDLRFHVVHGITMEERRKAAEKLLELSRPENGSLREVIINLRVSDPENDNPQDMDLRLRAAKKLLKQNPTKRDCNCVIEYVEELRGAAQQMLILLTAGSC